MEVNLNHGHVAWPVGDLIPRGVLTRIALPWRKRLPKPHLWLPITIYAAFFLTMHAMTSVWPGHSVAGSDTYLCKRH